MKNTSVIISTYTADVSGVCSALYELGGMVVIHDPSGCNSTYNTHDEPRWYDQDSLIFISGLSEIDAIMGSDDKLISDIIRAVNQLAPRFIALVCTPVPLMTGVDFEGIRDILEEKTGLPVFYFPTSGMHSYIQGVNMALSAVAEYMIPDIPDSSVLAARSGISGIRRRLRVNLLGVTPLDFSVNHSLASIRNLLTDQGFDILSCLAYGSPPEEIVCAGQADVNLVLSSAGISAADTFYRRFHIPYVVGLPTGDFAKVVMKSLHQCAQSKVNAIAYNCNSDTSDNHPKNDSQGERAGSCVSTIDSQKIYLIGEPVAAQSIREAVHMEFGLNIVVLSYLLTPSGLLDDRSIYLDSEEKIRDQLKDADVVIADPLYEPVCPDGIRFVPFPHEAFSGRIYRKYMPDLTKPEEILYNSLDPRTRLAMKSERGM